MENLVLQKRAAVDRIMKSYETDHSDCLNYGYNTCNDLLKHTYLLDLSINGCTIEGFSSTVYQYNYEVDCSIQEISIMPTAVYPDVDIRVNNKIVKNGDASDKIDLEVGRNKIMIKVISSLEEEITCYEILVNRLPNLFLSQLELYFTGEGYIKYSAFGISHSEIEYCMEASMDAASLVIVPYVEDSSNIITIAGQSLSSKEKSGRIKLTDNHNKVVINVTNMEYHVSRDYTLKVIKNYI